MRYELKHAPEENDERQRPEEQDDRIDDLGDDLREKGVENSHWLANGARGRLWYVGVVA